MCELAYSLYRPNEFQLADLLFFICDPGPQNQS